MAEFSTKVAQEVNAQLRDQALQSVMIRRIPPGERTNCNLEWYLTQQQNTRQVNRSGLQTRQEQSRNLLMSSQALKRSMLPFSRQMTRERESSYGLSTKPSDFGFLTQKKIWRPRSSGKNVRPGGHSKKKQLSQ